MTDILVQCKSVKGVDPTVVTFRDVETGEELIERIYTGTIKQITKKLGAPDRWKRSIFRLKVSNYQHVNAATKHSSRFVQSVNPASFGDVKRICDELNKKKEEKKSNAV